MRIVSYRSAHGVDAVGELRGEMVQPLAAATVLDWLRGDGRSPAGDAVPATEVSLRAPVPEPPSVRDFYAFERHVRAGWRRRGQPVPAQWFRAPAFYFSNPASILGPEEPVRRPTSTRMLDFELEIAAVIGGDGALAGFTLMNDWSARDVQREEVTVLLGPHKGKDFATSLGPWLVTPDELPYRDGRLDLRARVRVNGQEIGAGDAGRQHYSWDEILEHAARDTRLRAGDVLGSGTLDGGCLLELGPFPGNRWIEPGDVVEIEAPGLGILRTPVA